MRIGSHDVKPLYRVTWYSGSQRRSKLYTQRRSAEEKAGRVRTLGGKPAVVEEGLALFPSEPAQPLGLPVLLDEGPEASAAVETLEMRIWATLNALGPLEPAELRSACHASESPEYPEALEVAVGNGVFLDAEGRYDSPHRTAGE